MKVSRDLKEIELLMFSTAYATSLRSYVLIKKNSPQTRQRKLQREEIWLRKKDPAQIASKGIVTFCAPPKNSAMCSFFSIHHVCRAQPVRPVLTRRLLHN